jgi:hypothetical protein
MTIDQAAKRFEAACEKHHEKIYAMSEAERDLYLGGMIDGIDFVE